MDKEYLEITAPPLARPSGFSRSLVGWPFEAKLLRGISAGGKSPKVKGVAYSGGKMRLFGWSRPVVVDLAGLTIPENVPLLADHDNETLSRVGVVVPAVVDGTLVIDGEIVAEGDLAEQIVAQGKAGADWQLSIGSEVEEAELDERGFMKINGIDHEAPFYHVKKSTLREVSVVEMRRRTDAVFRGGSEGTRRVRCAEESCVSNFQKAGRPKADRKAMRKHPREEPAGRASGRVGAESRQFQEDDDS